MKEFKSLYAELYTPQAEPPHAFLLKVKVDNEKKGVKVDIRQEFYGREDLNEEEIQEEGYTGDDNFSWQGSLPPSWRKIAEDLIRKTRLTDEEEDIYLELEKEKGFPERPEQWRYFLQEILQAGLEAARLEAPFEAALINNSGEGSETTIVASFVERTITVHKKAPGTSRSKEIDWKELKRIMTVLHNLDLQDNGNPEPGKAGSFLNPGDGLWYNLPEDLRKPEKAQKKLEKVYTLFQEI